MHRPILRRFPVACRGVAGSRDGTPGAKEERLLGDDGHILSVS